MGRGLLLVGAVLAIASCKKKEEAASAAPVLAEPTVSSLPIVTSQTRPGETPWPVRFGAFVKAVMTSGPEAPTVPTHLEAYLELLIFDLDMHELIGTFPGAPAGTTFVSSSYEWRNSPRASVLETMVSKARTEAERVTPLTETETAVLAYTEVAAKYVRELYALHQYYETKAFVDDEFDRARRESPMVADARRELARVRAALWTSVIAAWREMSNDVPDSPRAVIERAWETCMRVGEAIVTGAKPEARATAISACRRSIPTVAALPPDLHKGFDATMREAALELGDHAARRAAWSLFDVPDKLSELTHAYVQLWPKLPASPAERATP